MIYLFKELVQINQGSLPYVYSSSGNTQWFYHIHISSWKNENNDSIMKPLYKHNVSWKYINDIFVIDQLGKISLGIN